MPGVISRTSEWIEHRTGLMTAGRRFLMEEIPASTGWPQVFGSVCLFLFLTQAITGVLLAFNYAPTPGDAYSSVIYILRKVAAGRMIHGLHHWGASLMIIAVFLHMTQVFIYGAYKKPREATWIAGAILLLLTLAFGLTGYCFPGTIGRIGEQSLQPELWRHPIRRIVSNPFSCATHGIGVVTFARFYAFHTMLLPAATALRLQSMCILLGVMG